MMHGQNHIKVINVEKPKMKIIMTTVELKKELITKWEKGTRVSDLAVQYGIAKSTISTILKNISIFSIV